MSIEEEFYKAFGIEKKYPEITDKMFLELFCLASKYDEIEGFAFIPEALKEWSLRDLISLRNIESVKEQVQSLFKGGK